MAREPFNKVWAENPDGTGPNTFQQPDDTRLEKGWVGGASGTPPKAGEENWWHNRVDEALQDIERQGALQWHAEAVYSIGGYAIGSDGRRYRSKADSNTGNDPVTDDGTSWNLAPFETVTTVVAADSPKTLTSAEAGLVLVDATNGAVSLTLPSASSNAGVSYRVVRTDTASGNAVTINPDGTDTVEGAANLDVVVGDRRTLESDGASDWKRPEPLASETTRGIVEKATPEEARTGEPDKYIDASLLEAVSLGWGQSWQDMSGSRSVGVTYTNTTGRPIQISVSGDDTGTGSMTVLVNGVTVANYGAGGIRNFEVIVPDGATYSFNIEVGSLQYWRELR